MAEDSKFADRLKGSPVGDLLPISGHDARSGEDYDTHAFVPRDLPDHVDLPATAWMAVSDAMAEIGRLDAAASLIPNPQLMARIATRRGAIGIFSTGESRRPTASAAKSCRAAERRVHAP